MVQYIDKSALVAEIKKHYNCGIINGDTVKLFDNSTIDIHPLYDVVLEDVTIEIADNGILRINAKEIEYDLYLRSDGRRIFEKDWQRTPHRKEIKERKRHFWSKKKERYINCGWVRTTETTPMQYILSKYKIEIYD